MHSPDAGNAVRFECLAPGERKTRSIKTLLPTQMSDRTEGRLQGVPHTPFQISIPGKFKEAQHGPNPPLDLVNGIDSLVNRIVELEEQVLNLEKTLRD